MATSIVNVAQPKYLQLAQTLFDEIEAGVYKVGTLLPTEHEVCNQFGVSRFTAREAFKRLVHLGIVTRHPGIGTRVIAKEVQSTYRQNMGAVNDLYQYATDTSLKIEHKEMVVADQALAQALDVSQGETWLFLSGKRYAPTSKLPIAETKIWICPAFRSVKGLNKSLHQAIHSLIEEQFGESIAMVEQDIEAVVLDEDIANALSVAPGTAGLKITRNYRNRKGDLIECAVSTHAAERFSYRSVFQREWRVEG
ncbi:GntR family transcriptional regulator [Pollutimonas bauzanensis]|uniref:GntR family transcriptional regulator n=1 Tax=Pollutimonas bauzanensis TaxID=658167 RepID=UPI003340AEFE